MKTIITGATGHMGKALIEAILDQHKKEIALSDALVPLNNISIGKDAAAFCGRETGTFISTNIASAMEKADCLIDFTRPDGTFEMMEIASRLYNEKKHKVKLVIGTTGFTEDQKNQISVLSEKLPIVLAPNMSIGVNVMFNLLESAARALSNGYDAEIIEAHHRRKVDAPSGTALKMGEIIAHAFEWDFQKTAVYERHGVIGAREDKTIGFATVRGGDIIGDHTALFAGMGERIEISHKSSSRQGYAKGSLLAALFLRDKECGLFNMQDVLGL